MSLSQHLAAREAVSVIAIALVLASSCASPTATSTSSTQAEFMSLDAEAFVGSALSGARADADLEALAWQDAWLVEVEVTYVDRAPLGALPVTGGVVVREGATDLLAARSELSEKIRHLSPATDIAALDAAWSRKVVLALPPSATVAIGGAPDGTLFRSESAAWKHWSLRVSRVANAAEPARLAMVLEGSAEASDRSQGEQDTGEPQSALPQIPVRETILFDSPLRADGGELRLSLPSPRASAPHGAFLVQLRVHAEPLSVVDRATLELALARSRANMRQALQDMDDDGSRTRGGFRFEAESALRSMRKHELQRPALLFLAQSTGAHFCEDFALIASEPALAEFFEYSGRLGELSELHVEGSEAFGWFLERSAMEWLATRLEVQETQLESELLGLWLRHTGELGRFPDLLKEGLARCSNSQDLAELLRNENRVLLEDSHPAARVRAFDWLAARGMAPEGFDPLASRDERRVALARESALESEVSENGAPETNALEANVSKEQR